MMQVHLIEGIIDQVNGTDYISWAQPKVLGIPHIFFLINWTVGSTKFTPLCYLLKLRHQILLRHNKNLPFFLFLELVIITLFLGQGARILVIAVFLKLKLLWIIVLFSRFSFF